MFLLRLILIFILIIIILRILGRLFFFSVIRNVNNKMNNFDREEYRKEGDVSVDSRISSKEKKFKKDDGDYVSYEEVD
jgi:hypothetical protein